MRAARCAAAVTAVFLLVTFGFPGVARAAASVSIDHASVTYVPAMAPQVGSSPAQKLTITPAANAADYDLHVTTNAPGGVDLGDDCTGNGTATVDCALTAVLLPKTLTMAYSVPDLDAAQVRSASKTYTTTAQLSVHDGAAAGSVKAKLVVKPSADLTLAGSAGITALGGGAGLVFTVTDQGPSGEGRITVTVTGFRSKATGLPKGCTASGLKVKCTLDGTVAADPSQTVQLPLTANESGCSYVVTLAGTSADPHTADNKQTFRNAGQPCAAPVASAAPSPSVSPSPSVAVASASAVPSVAGTPSDAVQVASAGDRRGLGRALVWGGGIGLLVVLVAFTVILIRSRPTPLG